MKSIYLLIFSMSVSQESIFKLDTLISNLNQPWGIEFLDAKNILITEKSGQLIRYDFKNKTHIAGLPKIDDTSQGGLLDIKKHPNYFNNNIIYFTATSDKDGKIGTSLYKAILAKDSLMSVKMLFHAKIESQELVFMLEVGLLLIKVALFLFQQVMVVIPLPHRIFQIIMVQ